MWTWRTAGVSVRAIAQDREQIEQLARSYTEAWCSRDPEQVARHYVSGGTIAINGGDPSGIADVAAAFIAAFPDIEVLQDDLVLRDDGSIKYGWTFTGTSAETGKRVRVPGFEEWTLSPDGLIAESRGHYDQAEYDRQLQHGIGAAQLRFAGYRLAMEAEPDRIDAEILLHAMEVYLSEPVVAARRFWHALPDGLGLAELDDAYPRGTEGRAHIDTLMIFWETIGGLLKRGLLREELAFDTFLDAPPWPKIERVIRDLRAERDAPAEGENLEYAYRRAMSYADERRS